QPRSRHSPSPGPSSSAISVALPPTFPVRHSSYHCACPSYRDADLMRPWHAWPMATRKELRRGLNPDGTIAREGAPDRVPSPFHPVVQAARAELAAAFGGRRMHSASLYGSVPRGTATPGTSDLDLLVALNQEPAPADRAQADAAERGLDRSF